MLEPFDWRFCYVSETEIFLQSPHLTDEFESQYGDLTLKISEQEFYILSLIETEALNDSKMEELWKIDCFFSCLDAYLSFVQASDSFELKQPRYDAEVCNPSVIRVS